jgi:hypothetical protein
MERVRMLLLLLLVVVAGKLGAEWLRWTTSGEERAQIGVLRDQVLDAGVEVVRAQARADTLRVAIEREDSALERQRLALERYTGRAKGGALSSDLYARYRRELARYNAHVTTRNERFARWQQERMRNRAAVDRYNQLSDSIRAIAGRIGEPYYPVPLPIEAAAERGLIQVDP